MTVLRHCWHLLVELVDWLRYNPELPDRADINGRLDRILPRGKRRKQVPRV